MAHFEILELHYFKLVKQEDELLNLSGLLSRKISQIYEYNLTCNVTSIVPRHRISCSKAIQTYLRHLHKTLKLASGQATKHGVTSTHQCKIKRKVQE